MCSLNCRYAHPFGVGSADGALAAYHLDSKSPDATAACAMAKRLATDLSFDIANQALQLHGAMAIYKNIR